MRSRGYSYAKKIKDHEFRWLMIFNFESGKYKINYAISMKAKLLYNHFKRISKW